MTQIADQETPAAPGDLDDPDRDVATILGLSTDVFAAGAPPPKTRKGGRGAAWLIGGAAFVAASIYIYGSVLEPRSHPVVAASAPHAQPRAAPPLAEVLLTPDEPATETAAGARPEAARLAPETARAVHHVRSLRKLQLASARRAKAEPSTATPQQAGAASPGFTFRLAESAKLRSPRAEEFAADRPSALTLTREEPQVEIKIRQERFDSVDAIRLLRRK